MPIETSAKPASETSKTDVKTVEVKETREDGPNFSGSTKEFVRRAVQAGHPDDAKSDEKK